MGSKKKGQETASLRSSSMRRDSVSATKTAHQTTHHQVSVGCMSGIFHFVSKYHNRRKLLTFGNNRKHQAREATTAPPQNPEKATCQIHDHQTPSARVTIEVPRSPVIPAEIRRSSSNSPIAVARLMGISETPSKPPVTTEKRRRLLGALEKCDEDVEALKSIIKAVRAVQTPPSTPPLMARGGGVEGEDDEMGSEGPSPVSVLDHRSLVTRSPNMSYSKRAREEKVVQQQHEQIIMHQEQQQRQHYSSRKRPVEEDNAIFCFQNRASLQSLFVPVKTRNQFNVVAKTCPTGPWSSTTRESVIEVCKDVEWGQRREVGNVVLLVQEIILRDLIDEIIKDMDCFHVSSAAYYARSLPCEACKRKLSFYGKPSRTVRRALNSNERFTTTSLHARLDCILKCSEQTYSCSFVAFIRNDELDWLT